VAQVKKRDRSFEESSSLRKTRLRGLGGKKQKRRGSGSRGKCLENPKKGTINTQRARSLNRKVAWQKKGLRGTAGALDREGSSTSEGSDYFALCASSLNSGKRKKFRPRKKEKNGLKQFMQVSREGEEGGKDRKETLDFKFRSIRGKAGGLNRERAPERKVDRQRKILGVNKVGKWGAWNAGSAPAQEGSWGKQRGGLKTGGASVTGKGGEGGREGKPTISQNCQGSRSTSAVAGE